MAFEPVHQKKSIPDVKKTEERKKRHSDHALVLATDCGKRKRKDGTVVRTYAMRITASSELLRAAGMEVGAKVEFEKDPVSRRCRIYPHPYGRWTVTTTEAMKGRKGYIKISYEPRMPTVEKPAPCHKPKLMRGGGLDFEVPDNASFITNLRADKEEQELPVGSLI